MRAYVQPGIFNVLPSQIRVFIVGGSFARFCMALVMKNMFLVTFVMPRFLRIFMSWLAFLFFTRKSTSGFSMGSHWWFHAV